jgi:hypothetical protein
LSDLKNLAVLASSSNNTITMAASPPRAEYSSDEEPMLTMTRAGVMDDAEEWGAAGVKLPGFDISEMIANTKANGAEWMHLAPSNLFTAAVAPRAQVRWC